MDRVARLPAAERNELFSESAAKMGTTPAVIEKDFWVTWVLDRLFAQPELARLLMFKGGTSLSKAYRLIERFSEDIDLILDWRVLGGEDPWAERSKSQQVKLNEAINEKALSYIGNELLPRVAAALDGVCACELEGGALHVVNIRYPGAFSDVYLRPEVRLEIGPLASWVPYEQREIGSYAAEAFPRVFQRRTCTVNVIKAERTFWEKATILHQEAHRPAGKVQPERHSRHYYDLSRMAMSVVKDAALADMTMLASVAEFKQRFYPCVWARYDLAKPGTLRLIPEGTVLATVKADYRAMANMMFGNVPEFDEVMAVLQQLQDEINGGGT
jgi:hypothetical protein